ncbi:MAG: lamin tail domain-containing protein [Candidatus Nitrosopelagicus sp.]|nr:lamin tail domain-containing protein [Candidatus Nitrosopelagicus sp.]
MVLIAGISAPAYSQTITDHIVINEVDTNPPGDDAESISEWVELYNPTDDDVDLSGWKIASTTVLKKTLTIPEGTIISSGDFLTFVNQKVWFTDAAESVELTNSDGLLIDKTREVFDLENDFKSWQRTYDGFSDWKFTSATAGSSNGKLTEDYASSDIVITLSSDKPVYNFDDTAVFGGTVSERVFVEKPSFQAEPILINISGPNYEQAVSLYPDSYLNYETSLRLVQVLGIAEGNYVVSVNYAGVTTNTSFSVEFKTIEETQESDSLLTVKTENSDYFPGQLITITGNTSEIIPFESIKFTITDSIGDLVTSGNLFTSDGQFQTSIFLTTVNPSYGVYTIDIEYGDHVESTTFNVIEESVDESILLVSDSIFFNVDKSEYLLNDSMTLSGTITNFDSGSDIYYQVVYFDFSASDGSSPMFTGHTKETSSDTGEHVEFKLTAIPDDSGNFSITARIPPIVFSEDDYVVKANYGGLIGSQSFSIVSEIDSDVQTDSTGNLDPSISEKSSDVFNVRTIIEKINRISDALVSINTEEKIIENESVKPRVLSGSMITIDKNRQSDVNLQVTSESGICIIGPDVECLVSESTRKPSQIFDVVQVDGLNLNVRYSGPDVLLEKFSILPTSSGEFLPNTTWNVEVIKDDEISRLYYKITYKTLE